MLGTSRTRLFFSNSRSSCATLPSPRISSSNRVPSPISPADSLRARGVLGFHLGKFATLTTVSNTCSTGLLMTCVSFRTGTPFLLYQILRYASGDRRLSVHSVVCTKLHLNASSSEARFFGLLKKRSLQPLRLCYSADLNVTPLKHRAEGITIDPGQVRVKHYKDESKGKSTNIQEC